MLTYVSLIIYIYIWTHDGPMRAQLAIARIGRIAIFSFKLIGDMFFAETLVTTHQLCQAIIIIDILAQIEDTAATLYRPWRHQGMTVSSKIW